MTEQSNQPASIDAQPTANGNASVAEDATSAQTPPASRPVPREEPDPLRGSDGFWPVCSVLLSWRLSSALGIPWVEAMLNTVSTDDAYVNSHVTFVAPAWRGKFPRAGG